MIILPDEGIKISVATPILNEEVFLPFYLSSVSSFAHEVVITDGGSTDNSLTQLQLFAEHHRDIKLDLKIQPQTGMPYSDSWDEGMVRNDLLNRCTGDVILLLDADEVVAADEVTLATTLMLVNNKSLANFVQIPFWGDLRHVRLCTEDDPRWYGVGLARLIKREKWIYNKHKHHCNLVYIGSDGAHATIHTTSRLYHLHYGFGLAGLKYRDNRRGDIDSPNKCSVEIADFDRVPTVGYFGPWPDTLKEEFLDTDK